MVLKRTSEKRKNEILLQKMQDTFFTSSDLNPYVRDYYCQLNQRFNTFIFCHIKRARNGFREKSLDKKLKKLSLIRPAIDKIADLNNSNHPHIGVARELAEQTFYSVQGIYTNAINPLIYFIN